MVNCAQQQAATTILAREARYLDTRAFDEWLELFHEQAIFWVPIWKDDGTPTRDPETELSLIYCSSREQLRERAERAAGGRSVASMPPMRTAHSISNILVTSESRGRLLVHSVVTSHVYNPKKREQNVFSHCRNTFLNLQAIISASGARHCSCKMTISRA